MKKVFIYSLLTLVAFVGINNVDAKTYTSYNKGDRITVNVNNSTQAEFYVLSDSNNQVTAILQDVLNENQTYQNINGYLSRLNWTNVNGLRLPTMNDIFTSFDNSSEESFKFTEPTWAVTVSSYWTSTVAKDNWHWTVGSTIDGTGSAGAFEDSASLAVRPVITVAKDYVVGGAYDDGNIGEAIPEPETQPQPEQEAENPNTGINNNLLIIGGIAVVGFLISATSKKKSKFPQI